MNNEAAGIFLDRDGTINVPPPPGGYVTRWDDFRFVDSAFDALAALRAAGCRLILATNQKCISKGLCSREQVEEIHRRMQDALLTRQAHLDLIQYAAGPDGDPLCKPLPGMLEHGLRVFGLARERCVMVGDSARDIVAGRAAGVHTVLVTEHCYPDHLEAARAAGPDAVVADLAGATAWIVERLQLRASSPGAQRRGEPGG